MRDLALTRSISHRARTGKTDAQGSRVDLAELVEEPGMVCQPADSAVRQPEAYFELGPPVGFRPSISDGTPN